MKTTNNYSFLYAGWHVPWHGSSAICTPNHTFLCPHRDRGPLGWKVFLLRIFCKIQYFVQNQYFKESYLRGRWNGHQISWIHKWVWWANLHTTHLAKTLFRRYRHIYGRKSLPLLCLQHQAAQSTCPPCQVSLYCINWRPSNFCYYYHF